MKIPYYFGMSIMLLLANVPNSYSSYTDIHLIKQIKPYILAKSKPIPTYTKYAAVSFLKSADTAVDFKGTLDVKSQCGALGYVIPTSKCSGDMKPSKLCSADASMKNVQGADDYTTGCCDSRIYTATETETCNYNAAKLSNDKCYYEYNGKFQNMYRCACDRGRYQYSTIPGEWCGVIDHTNLMDVTRFNTNLGCKAYEPRTQKDEYYFISCCPKDYDSCTSSKHQMGVGNECRVIGGGTLDHPTIISKYEKCVCATHYDTICSDGQLIDVDNYCSLDGGKTKFTTETNCESDCTKTSETNIDDYLYGKVWHCLYEPEGATLKQSYDEILGGLCSGYIINSQNLPELNTQAFYECYAQGYTKSVADCYESSTIIHCPTDPTRVWCIESKYCTGYDVGGQACRSLGSDIEICPSSDTRGIRCRYKSNDCNTPWTEGTFKSEDFVNYDTNVKGDDEHCCKRGYVMNNNGICVPNSCTTGENEGKYPYEQNPGKDAGEMEICYEADTNESLGYKAYFGYTSCKGNIDEGEMWEPDASNSRKCICKRQNDTLGWLPFGLELFFDTNGDASDNYAHTGFGEGKYGEYHTCTDAEGTYYGYTACYIGNMLGTTQYNKGKCIYPNNNGGVQYIWSTGSAEINGRISEVTTANGGPAFTGVSTSTNPDNSPCVNYYHHCKDQYGQKKGEQSACDLVVEGCLKGNEEACNLCYHTINLKVNDDGYYEAHGLFKLKIYSTNNTWRYVRFDECPTGYYKYSAYYGFCSRYCSVTNLSQCRFNDIVTSDGTQSGLKIGIVYAKTASKIYIIAHRRLKVDGTTSLTWQQAMDAAKEYVPDDYKNNGKEYDPTFGKETWKLPSTSEISASIVGAYPYAMLNNAFMLTGNNVSLVPTWTRTEAGDNAYYRNSNGTSETLYKTDKTYALPVRIINLQ